MRAGMANMILVCLVITRAIEPFMMLGGKGTHRSKRFEAY
jgi:hypothetical protein